MSAKLLFVYNAEAGIVAGLMDSIHKTLSPSTYSCSLCAITYGAFAMDARWKSWLKTLPYEAVFYHRPDFRAAFPRVEVGLPAILRETDGVVVPLMTAEEIASASTVDALIAALETKLA